MEYVRQLIPRKQQIGDCPSYGLSLLSYGLVAGRRAAILWIDQQAVVAEQDDVVSSISGHVNDETFSRFGAPGVGLGNETFFFEDAKVSGGLQPFCGVVIQQFKAIDACVN